MNGPGAAPFAYEGLERIFHERGRLGVCTCLVANTRGMSFKALQDACGLTDGNLNRHLHALVETGIVTIAREKSGSRTVSIVGITDEGRTRFLSYIDELEAVVRTAREHEPVKAAGLRLQATS